MIRSNEVIQVFKMIRKVTENDVQYSAIHIFSFHVSLILSFFPLLAIVSPFIYVAFLTSIFFFFPIFSSFSLNSFFSLFSYALIFLHFFFLSYFPIFIVVSYLYLIFYSFLGDSERFRSAHWYLHVRLPPRPGTYTLTSLFNYFI